MKKKFTVIYSVFAALLYAISIFYLSFNLIYEYKTGNQRTRRHFDHTSNVITQNLTKISNGGQSSEVIKNLILNSFDDFNDFAYIELFEDGKTIYIYGENTLANGNKSKLLLNYEKSFKLNGKTYFFTANLYKLSPFSIFHYGKISFFIILIVTAITFILIIISNIKAVNTVENESEKNEDSIKISEKEENSPSAPEIIENISEEKDKKVEEIFEKLPESDKKAELNSDFSEEKNLFDFSEVLESDEKTPKTENSEIQNDVAPTVFESKIDEKVESNTETIENKISEEITEENEISGNENEENLETESPEQVTFTAESSDEIFENPDYSVQNEEIVEEPKSEAHGFEKSENLIPKLDEELEDAISTESDLSLFIIKITNLSAEDEATREIFNYITAQFQKNYIVGEESIACIKNDTNIDKAIELGDEFHREILKILNNDKSECFIGISSRALRMIGAKRLLTEAQMAVEHAQEDKENPIVAFRADAEKFREYIESK